MRSLGPCPDGPILGSARRLPAVPIRLNRQHLPRSLAAPCQQQSRFLLCRNPATLPCRLVVSDRFTALPLDGIVTIASPSRLGRENAIKFRRQGCEEL